MKPGLLAGISLAALPLLGAMGTASAATLFTQTTPGTYSFMAPATEAYDIDAYGAPGGGGGNGAYPGGSGAEASAQFALTAGETLTIYVGGVGDPQGGGGGGTFVLAGSQVLVVAGGGGGGSGGGPGGNASLTTSGVDGISANNHPSGLGGVNGAGGGAGDFTGGGGGIAGNGSSASSSSGGNGLTGSPPLQGGGGDIGSGGFGGGAGRGFASGGGGGGYSGGGGGGGGGASGGGGSFVDTSVGDGFSGSEILMLSALTTGEIVISGDASTADIFEPASSTLFCLGLGGLGLARRARSRAR